MENKTKKIELEIPIGKTAKWIDNVLTLVDEKPQDVTERIKTFEDACNELGDEHPLVTQYQLISAAYESDPMTGDLIAYLKLRIITAALNEGWEPQFIKNEERWYFWYDLITQKEYDKLSAKDKSCVVYRGAYNANASGGMSLAGAFFDALSSYASAGSRLAFKNKKLAEYAGRQFAEIYSDFFFKP